MKLLHPWFLLLFLIYVPLIINYIRRRKQSEPTLEMSSLAPLATRHSSWRVKLMPVCFGLRLLAMGCIIVSLCRPQTSDAKLHLQTEGTDIVMALDLSTSMNGMDITPTRFQAARNIASNFIMQRENDNVGLVGFGNESLTFVPLTSDQSAVTNSIRTLSPGILGPQTALGDGLLSAINRVLGGKAVSKSVILLTDGTNTAGEVSPLMAADVAKEKGVKVYTIGMGVNGSQDLDEQTLQSVADATGGKYFRATDRQTLQQVFDEIDKLEKSEIDSDSYVRWQDNFMPWIAGALICLVISFVCRYTLLRRIP